MAADRPSLSVRERSERGSRSSRRLRRSGDVPAVLYGGGEAEPVALKVNGLELNRLLADGAALFDLDIDGSRSVPAILKDQQNHPVRSDVLHVDFLEVRLDQKIQSTVAVELTGADDAPGVRDGGVLDLAARELTIEALPTDIPELIEVDVSGMEMGATLMLSEIPKVEGVDFLDDLEETVVATVILPTVEEEPTIEEETELVGEDGEAARAEGDSEGGDDADSGDGDSSSDG